MCGCHGLAHPEVHHHGHRDCCAPGHGWRRFRSKEEEIEELKRYKEQLEQEIKDIERRIEELER